MRMKQLLVITGICGCTAPVVVLAEETTGGATIEEIVVTAQKREQSVQDIPFSITALTGEKLQEQGAKDFSDLARLAPSLNFVNQGPGQNQLNIRGINTGPNFRDSVSSFETVGTYLDEVPISMSGVFTPDLDLFDMQRVEVLRGPQGTLYGSGSLAGTVKFVTAPPDLSNFNGPVEGGLSSTHDGGTSYLVKGAVNLPLRDDVAALRLVGYSNYDDGFIKGVGQGISNVNWDDKDGARIGLLFKPIANFTINPLLVYQRVRSGGFPQDDVYSNLNPDPTGAVVSNPVSGGNYQQFREHREGIDDNFRLASLKLDYDFGPVTLMSNTAYIDRDVLTTRDFRYFIQSVYGPGTISNEIPPSAPLIDSNSLKSLTEEVRLASASQGRLTWVAGAYYTRQTRTYGQSLPVPNFTEATGIDTASLGTLDNLYESAFDYHLKQEAVFGEATLNVTSSLAAIAGLRWYDVNQTKSQFATGYFNGGPLTEQNEATEVGVNPRYMLTYKLAHNVLISAQVSDGFRLGGINDKIPDQNPGDLCYNDSRAVFGGPAPSGYDPEKLRNYEFDVKSQFADGRIQLNADVFQMEYKELQSSRRLGCSFTVIVNAGRGTSSGTEIEMTAAAAQWLKFSVGGSYVNARLSEVAPGFGAIEGERLPLSPKLDFNAIVSGQYQVIGSLRGLYAISYSYTGDRTSYFSSASGVPDPLGNLMPSYSLTNLRLGLKGANWQASLFANNVTDERAILYIDRERAGGTYPSGTRRSWIRNQPRTLGMDVQYRF